MAAGLIEGWHFDADVLSQPSDRDLLLVLTPDAVLSPFAIERLVARVGAEAALARSVPLGGESGEADAACVLTFRSSFGASLGDPHDSGLQQDLRSERRVVDVPEASVHRGIRLGIDGAAFVEDIEMPFGEAVDGGAFLPVEHLLASIDPDRADPAVIEAIEGLLEAVEPRARSPFLTVIVRTQGRRPRALEDALLSLLAQSDQSFDVLLMGHDVDDDGLDALRELVAAHPSSFAERVKVESIRGGLRGAPLNAAIRLVDSEYFAVFDDDDVLLANWVAAFHSAAVRAPGRILRAVVGTQRLEPEDWRTIPDGFRPVGSLEIGYPVGFDLAQHLVLNRSPFMSWAFPTDLVTRFGLAFDETLPVTEDWDFILRATQLLSVHDVGALTSIYRRWEGFESSTTAHDLVEWERAEARVRARFGHRPVLFQSGSAPRIGELVTEVDNLRRANHEIVSSRSWRLTRHVRWAMRVARRIREGRVGRREAAPREHDS